MLKKTSIPPLKVENSVDFGFGWLVVNRLFSFLAAIIVVQFHSIYYFRIDREEIFLCGPGFKGLECVDVCEPNQW